MGTVVGRRGGGNTEGEAGNDLSATDQHLRVSHATEQLWIPKITEESSSCGLTHVAGIITRTGPFMLTAGWVWTAGFGLRLG